MEMSNTNPSAPNPRHRVSASRVGGSIGIPQTDGPGIPRQGARIGHPAVTAVEITDPTRAGQGIEVIDQDAVQLGSTPFRATRVVVRLEGGAVVHHATNHRVRTRTKAQQGLVGYVSFGPRTRGTVNGLPIRPDLTLAVEAGTEVTIVAEAGHQSVTFLLPPAVIERHLEARRQEGEVRLPHGAEMLQTNAVMARRLFDWGKRLVEAAARQPALFNDRKEARVAAQAEMVETLLTTLGSTQPFEPSRAVRGRRAQALIVKTAEDYVLSHTHDHVHVDDLCRAASVSERALQYAFKEVLGVTPVAYLIRLRLHRVRQLLVAAGRGSTTVSTVALDWGFWHFGEFSSAYRKCFGERPSDTLRRGPGKTRR
jgi:AraC family ethanolamine operon transcriptional activator